ncbi:MAG TPA: TOBE domain-containing protein [bacterium]|nr:TOBE domain-containing protein [bacterium]
MSTQPHPSAQPPPTVTGRLWLEKEQRGFLGHGRIELLRQIGERGSIAQAARAMGMSYKAAWDAVDAVNNLAEQPLVVRTRGGARGGATHLTEAGRELIRVFAVFEAEHTRFLSALSARIGAPVEFDRIARRLALQTSARNQFWGRVTALRQGELSAEVTLDIGGGNALAAVITNESAEALGLHEGAEACALIKASLVIVATPEGARGTSARNRLCGTVSRCREGTVNGEVSIALEGGKTITATLTTESIRALGLAEGRPACALVKASHVILAVTA